MELHARWWAILAVSGYTLTWAAIYIISLTFHTISFVTGFEISQAMAYRPARFVGTAGGFVAIFSHFMCILYRKYMFDAFCKDALDEQRSLISFFLGCVALLGLVVVSSVQADRQDNTANDQFWVHQTGAFLGFSGLIGYMLIDSFYVDLRLKQVLPGYKTPILFKQWISRFASLCFVGTMVFDLWEFQVTTSLLEISCALSIVVWWLSMWQSLSFVSFQMKVIPEYEQVPLLTTPIMATLTPKQFYKQEV